MSGAGFSAGRSAHGGPDASAAASAHAPGTAAAPLPGGGPKRPDDAAALRAEAPLPASVPPQASASRRTASREQRVFVRIPADREQPGVLRELRRLLDGHPGPLRTVLYYEREQRTIELGDSVRVKPSRELFAAIVRLLGEGTAVVK
jgi:DNA polymerase-3 subunit alpha